MLLEIFPRQRLSTLLEVDNQAAIAVANAQSRTKRSKYVDVRFHHLQDAVLTGILQIVHTSSPYWKRPIIKIYQRVYVFLEPFL